MNVLGVFPAVSTQRGLRSLDNHRQRLHDTCKNTSGRSSVSVCPVIDRIQGEGFKLGRRLSRETV